MIIAKSIKPIAKETSAKNSANYTKRKPKTLNQIPWPIILTKQHFQGKYLKNYEEITSHAFIFSTYTFYAFITLYFQTKKFTFTCKTRN